MSNTQSILKSSKKDKSVVKVSFFFYKKNETKLYLKCILFLLRLALLSNENYYDDHSISGYNVSLKIFQPIGQ